MNEIRLGDKVETCVFVCNERVPICTGIVVGIKDQIAEVDIMGLHGGEPWIIYEVLYTLKKVEE